MDPMVVNSADVLVVVDDVEADVVEVGSEDVLDAVVDVEDVVDVNSVVEAEEVDELDVKSARYPLIVALTAFIKGYGTLL